MAARHSAFVALIGLLLGPAAHAAIPEAAYPPDWRSWPVVKEGRIPAQDESLADLPPIVRQTFRTYSWVNDGRGSPYAIRMHPDKKGGKDYGSGPTAVFQIKELGVIFVTGHLRGVVSVYGVYTADGKDLSGSHPSLKTKVCRSCHASRGPHSSGKFGCVKGICSQ